MSEFKSINVENINIVDKDGTVIMRTFHLLLWMEKIFFQVTGKKILLLD
ncbi:hypothetical protein ACFVR2_19220 [Gottfriedia sp. NPDC057991]